eukprot:7206694-Pyramimonas_sp.AAC.1
MHDRVTCEEDAGNGWMVWKLKTQRCTLAVGVAYMVADLGVSGENIRKMRHTSNSVNSLSIP